MKTLLVPRKVQQLISVARRCTATETQKRSSPQRAEATLEFSEVRTIGGLTSSAVRHMRRHRPASHGGQWNKQPSNCDISEFKQGFATRCINKWSLHSYVVLITGLNVNKPRRVKRHKWSNSTAWVLVALANAEELMQTTSPEESMWLNRVICYAHTHAHIPIHIH